MHRIENLKPSYKGIQSRLINEAAPKLKKRKRCPKCDKVRAMKFFGVRVQHDKKTGKPLSARAQSYCTPCRKLKN